MMRSMRAFAVFLTPSGDDVELGHGELVGRLRRAELRLDDPRVSEVHAMVSLRGQALRLLALRGRLKLEGRAVNDIALEPGQRIELAPGLALSVEDVILPDEVLGLAVPGLPPVALQGVLSFWARPTPRFEPGLHADADLVLWGEEGSWKARLGHSAGPGQGDAVVEVAAGTRLNVAGLALEAVAIPLSSAATDSTLLPDAPLRIRANYDTAQVHQGKEVALLAGVPARLISELVALGGPAPWEVVAHELWGQSAARDQLRTRFDMALSRLRKRLRAAHIREDLVVSSGTGHVELVLREGDLVEDGT